LLIFLHEKKDFLSPAVLAKPRHMMRMPLTVALGAGLLLSVAARAATLTDVQFQGNKRVATETLMGVVGLTPGQKIDRKDVVAAFARVVDEYKKDNVGATIQPEMITTGDNMKVVFKIAEEAVSTNPVLDYETFTGNLEVTSDKLAPALTMHPGSEVTRARIEADLKRLSAIYKAQKVPATITPKVAVRPAGHVEINYEIAEGKRRKHPPPLE
jgi:outer membrane protein assembly factor BamA